MAGTVPSLADHAYGGEGRRTSHVDECQSLQESSTHIRRATGGGTRTTNNNNGETSRAARATRDRTGLWRGAGLDERRGDKQRSD